MASVNKVILVGHLGKEAEIRNIPSGSKKASFSLATTERVKDKNTGEYSDKTEWHNVVAWGSLADVIDRLNVSKGSFVYIEGKITQRSWDDPSGNGKKYITEIIAEKFQILSNKNNSTTKPETQSYNNINDDDLPF